MTEIESFVRDHQVAVFLITMVLAVIGAWQGILWLVRGVIGAGREIQRRYRSHHAHGQYYFSERVCEYRVPLDGGTYLNRRTEEIVPLTSELHKARIGYRWTADGELPHPQIESLTAGRMITLIKDTGDHEGGAGWNGWVLEIDPPLKKRLFRPDVCRYVVTTAIKPTKRPQPFYSTKSEKRLDRLLIRVSFPPERLPKDVRYRIVDSYDEDLEPPKDLSPDSLTGLCEVEQKNPQPFVRHKIVWTW